MDPDDAKRRSRGISADMSPEAILRRIGIVSELYDVWRTLKTTRQLGPGGNAGEVREPPAGEWPAADQRPPRP
jgi:hypothetical protein